MIMQNKIKQKKRLSKQKKNEMKKTKQKQKQSTKKHNAFFRPSNYNVQPVNE